MRRRGQRYRASPRTPASLSTVDIDPGLILPVGRMRLDRIALRRARRRRRGPPAGCSAGARTPGATAQRLREQATTKARNASSDERAAQEEAEGGAAAAASLRRDQRDSSSISVRAIVVDCLVGRALVDDQVDIAQQLRRAPGRRARRRTGAERRVVGVAYVGQPHELFVRRAQPCSTSATIEQRPDRVDIGNGDIPRFPGRRAIAGLWTSRQ